MKYFPDSALVQLEFDKIKTLLRGYCRSEFAKSRSEDLRIHTQLPFIELELQQAHEFKSILQQSQYFPDDYVLNLSKDIKLLSIPGAVLTGDQFIQLRKLTECIITIFKWFDAERKSAYPGLAKIISITHAEKKIITWIDEILSETGMVRDDASRALASIRQNLERKRAELRRQFERIISRLNKAGYMADIEESFLNGRRVVAVFAEHKRQVKGILHGESDTRKTAFIEPEETIGLNNDIFSLVQEEDREVYRILRDLTGKLYPFASLLQQYHDILGEYDFIRAKSRLAIEINGNYPSLSEKSSIHLIQAFHPLLLLYNRRTKKVTVPTDIRLDDTQRILVISGPNAGGKTVTLKTVGLLQLMLQAGLLVPVHPDSQMGIFKQLMIHIGDTQSLEFELSTYSSQLKNLKYIMENANGRTLFFIDELGSGSDPNLGGAFAEVILEELVNRHAYGIVTTHYLNLKVMANKTAGIVNGAMTFDEKNLEPMYKLIIGQPGSSYTFSIAERIGLDAKLIAKAKSLVDEGHFRLDKLLNRAEQDQRELERKEKELRLSMKEYERMRKEADMVMNREKHRQQVEMLKQQNRITEERITYLKEMERKLKQIVLDWKKTDNKDELIRQMRALLFAQKANQQNERVKKKFDRKYIEIGGEIEKGQKVMMKKNHQVGLVKEIRGKKAIVQVGMVPITVSILDLTLIREKEQEEQVD